MQDLFDIVQLGKVYILKENYPIPGKFPLYNLYKGRLAMPFDVKLHTKASRSKRPVYDIRIVMMGPYTQPTWRRGLSEQVCDRKELVCDQRLWKKCFERVKL
jgi:hypothetical protein